MNKIANRKGLYYCISMAVEIYLNEYGHCDILWNLLREIAIHEPADWSGQFEVQDALTEFIE